MPSPTDDSNIVPAKLSKRLDTLYRSARQMSGLTLFGVVIPILLPIAASLGLLYHFWRRKLLAAPEFQDIMRSIQSADKRSRKRLAEGTDVTAKLAYLYLHGSAFLFPVILVAVILIFTIVCILYYALVVART